MDLGAQLAAWTRRLELTLDAIARVGGKVDPVFRQGAPDPIRKGAPNHSVLRGAEHDVDRKLPPILIDVFSEQVALHGGWRLPAELGARLPEDTRHVLSGGIDLSVREMVTAEMARQALVAESYDDPENPAHAAWHGKFAFRSLPNGDFLVLSDGTGAVHSLSPEGGAAHGVELAPSLIEFLDRWSLIGFVGPESALLLPFLQSGAGIDARGALARAWRSALTLSALEAQ